jgi:2-polyprenyl-3-methyl-5-hydroxy-6-metoxy-1,4-benzoquinol methylase
MKKSAIVEKKLGITGDYQFKALRSHNFLQANWHRNKLIALDKLINLYKPKTVLDLGAGSGNFEITFAKRVKKVTAVDYNKEAVSFLKSQLKKLSLKNVKLINQDILKLSKVKNLGKFDMILMVDALEHLPYKPTLKLIESFKNILNKNGKVVIITPNYRGFWPLIEKLIDTFTNIPHLENMQHITKYNPEKLKKIFQQKGFRPIKFMTFNNISFLIPNKNLSSAICKIELSLAFPYGNLLEYVFEL